jgi:MFS transporter, DHA2 family, metal-tetracycline-proton antiporter
MRLMMFTVMISSMSALMFNVVLPQISEEFHLTLAQVSWLSSAYMLIYAFGTVTYGKLADRFQLKSILTFGLTVFAAGSLMGLISQTFWFALLAIPHQEFKCFN